MISFFTLLNYSFFLLMKGKYNHFSIYYFLEHSSMIFHFVFIVCFHYIIGSYTSFSIQYNQDEPNRRSKKKNIQNTNKFQESAFSKNFPYMITVNCLKTIDTYWRNLFKKASTVEENLSFYLFFHYFFAFVVSIGKWKKMLFIGNFFFLLSFLWKKVFHSFFFFSKERRKKSQSSSKSCVLYIFFSAFYLWNCYQGDTSISGVSAHVLWLNISCEKQYLSGNIKDSYERNEQTSAHFTNGYKAKKK